MTNLISRNKEMERQMRRQQRRQERKEEKKAQAAAAAMNDDGESMDIDDEHAKRSERRHHRHHRHRSPRPEKEGDMNEEGGDKAGEDVDEEAARRARKQERRERRERKEKRAQRRLEKEAEAERCEDEERIPLPLFIVRVPGYAGQSSDSEASISVVRRVREEQKFKKRYVSCDGMYWYSREDICSGETLTLFFSVSILTL